MCFPFGLWLLFVLFLFSFESYASGLSPLPKRLKVQPAVSFLCEFPLRKQQLSCSMDSSTGSVAQSTSFGTTATTSGCTGVGVAATTTTTIQSVTSVSPVRLGGSTTSAVLTSNSGSNTTTSVVVAGTATAINMPNLASSNSCLQQQQQQQQQQQAQSLIIENMKQDDFNNVSLASAASEGQRSLSGAPSASSSPILSPPGKIFGRNANGTLIATSRPSNEAEIQLYRVLQRASLLSYYDTLLEMGGDDVQQLYEAGEEEFLEIMALVGMASKPLHVRRLQKALHEWANNPALFQGLVMSTSTGMCETPTKSALVFNPEASSAIFSRIKKLPTFNPSSAFNPTPLISTAAQTQSSTASAAHLLTHSVCSPTVSLPIIQPQSPMVATTLPLPSAAAALAATALVSHQPSGSTAHQVSSSSPQLTPVLTELQVTRITLGAEKIANQLPQREPRTQTSKKRTSRELEQVIAMSENDPRRMEEIRKYSAIYGRFDCKRRPEKPLTLHEVCVNEAAAQLCRLVPALLTRRDELFPLARQIVKDAGFGHSASIARYGALLPQVSMQASTAAASSSSSSSLTALGAQRSSVLVDCESSDSTISSKRQRLSSTETTAALELNREFNEDSRYNLFAMYQKFAKPPFDLSDIAKFSLGKTDFDDNDNDNDNDSRFSFSNSSNSPSSMPHNGNGESERERDVIENVNAKFSLSAGNITRCLENIESNNGTNLSSAPSNRSDRQSNLFMAESSFPSCSNNQARVQFKSAETRLLASNENSPPTTPFGGVQVISAAAAGHIIAVANPALVMSPTMNEPTAMSLKREADTPDN